MKSVVIHSVSGFPCPPSLTQVIRKFAKQLDEWLKVALHDLPENLRNIKFECKWLHDKIRISSSDYTCCVLFLQWHVQNKTHILSLLFAVSRRFSQILKRQTSLNHLCQVTIMLWILFLNKVYMNKHSCWLIWVCVYVILVLLIYLSPGIKDGDKQHWHHLPNARGLEECGPEQHHQADTLHHGGLTRGAQAAHYPL